jgi:hypothetical protein
MKSLNGWLPGDATRMQIVLQNDDAVVCTDGLYDVGTHSGRQAPRDLFCLSSAEDGEHNREPLESVGELARLTAEKSDLKRGGS